MNPMHLELVTRKEHMLKTPNNITYLNLSKTHCKHGHEFTPENTYFHKGKRYCRTCQRGNSQSYELRQRKER